MKKLMKNLMELLIEEEKQNFPLEREIANNKGVLGGNEVASEEDSIELVAPSAEADKSEDNIEERPMKKRRKLQRSLASEVVDRRARLRARRLVPTRMRTASMHSYMRDARTEDEWSSEWLPLDVPMDDHLEEGEEREDETETEPLELNKLAVESNSVEELLGRVVAEEWDEQLWVKELECAELWRSLLDEKYIHKKKEIECKDLLVDINNAQKVIVELRGTLELLRKGFERKFKRPEELTANLAARDQLHVTKLASRAKELVDCKAV
ncbi:hypothetical protein AXG93_1640s1010 [Marchantia polymorpha subsp. ruderalis]|uniref:Uncharacterized protein n=1 Tax=Marchantia polymorpha subsp. ruderalis TaxID=1480154 RepID=A0A176WCH9_MARPO|nr:hypothetical protein AXG93_1640s1010 [Marchantia polymorpha subsp. ruderalis]